MQAPEALRRPQQSRAFAETCALGPRFSAAPHKAGHLFGSRLNILVARDSAHRSVRAPVADGTLKSLVFNRQAVPIRLPADAMSVVPAFDADDRRHVWRVGSKEGGF